MKTSTCLKLLPLFSLLFLMLGRLPAGAQANLVVNGEFQAGVNGTNGWSFSAQPMEGTYTLDGAEESNPGFIAIGGTYPDVTMSQTLPTVPGAFYHVSFSYFYYSSLPSDFPLQTAAVDFGGVPLNYTYTNKASVEGYDFIVQASQTNLVLSFTCGTDGFWIQTLGHISVVPVASFAVQPTNQTVTLSSNACFTASLSGSSPLSYQWYFNTALLAGQTNATLTLTNVATASQGNYFVVLTNDSGSITSDPAALAVFVPPNLITNGDFHDGTNAWNFSYNHDLGANIITTSGNGYASVSGTGSAVPTLGQAVATTPGAYYQVSFSYFDAVAPGSTTPFLNCNFGGIPLAFITTNVFVPNTYAFIVQASQTNTLLNFTFEVDPNWQQSVGYVVVTPVSSFTLQPPAQSVALSSNASFTAGAIGAAPLTYAWYFNTNLLAGQTGATFTLTDFNATNQGNYFVVLTNDYGSITSQVAVLSVARSNLVINGNFQNGENGAGGWTLYYNPLAGTVSFNDGLVQGSSPEASVSQILATMPGAFYKISLNYRMNIAPPAVPFGLDVYFGSSLLTCVYTNLNAVPNHYDFIAQAAPTNTVLTFSFNTDLNWYQGIDNVSVTPVSSFDLQPPSQTVVLSSNASFTASVAGAAPLNYNWYFNNAALPGQTGATLPLVNVAGTNRGTYFVVLTNGYGSITSAVAALSVVFPSQAFTSTVTNGNQLSLTLTGTPGYPFTLQVATNLMPPINWQSIATNSADVNGQWHFVITNPGSPQYYRAVGQ